MPKTRKRKETEVQKLADSIERSKSIVLTAQRSVPVREIEVLRRDLKKEQGEFQSIKKTLLSRVLSERKLDIDAAKLDGTVGLAFSYGDEVAAAKIVAAFAKKNEGLSIVGGVLEGKLIGSDMVKQLAALPGKQDLLAQVVRTMQGPVRGFATVLAGTVRGFVQVLSAIKESKN
jgi:large subunit ribosomal protein L10